MNKQHGASPLIMVFLTLSVAILMVYSLQQTQQQSRFSQRIFHLWLEAFTEAQSALGWGLQQPWSAGEQLSCRQAETGCSVVCLWPTTRDTGWLAGASTDVNVAAAELTVWQRVTLRPDGQKYRLVPQRHGWRDDCPLSPSACLTLSTQLHPRQADRE